jgi:hypothetical protein
MGSIGLIGTFLAGVLGLGFGAAWAGQVQPYGDIFSSKAAAQRRAMELKCAGTFAMAQGWAPCQNLEAYAKAIGGSLVTSERI